MMEILNNDTLSKLHHVELEIMDEIHRICLKHKIKYFLDSGSALGAIRHGGFIPWDDDMDIGILREDYERFLSIAPGELREGFALQTYKNDKSYYKLSAKVHKLGTFYPEKDADKYKYQCIFIDVFPFDFAPDCLEKDLKKIRLHRRLMSLYYLRFCGYNRSELYKRLIYRVLCLFPLSLYRRLLYFSHSFNVKKRTNTLICYSYKMLIHKDLFFKYSDIMPTKLIKFEDRDYYIMNNPDAYLKVMYNNYMQLPPENKRECHVNGIIKFSCNE